MVTMNCPICGEEFGNSVGRDTPYGHEHVRRTFRQFAVKFIDLKGRTRVQQVRGLDTIDARVQVTCRPDVSKILSVEESDA